MRVHLWVLAPWLVSFPLLAVDVYAWSLGAGEMGPVGLLTQDPAALAVLGVLILVTVPPALVLLFAKLLRNVSHLLGFDRLAYLRSVRYSSATVLLFVCIPFVHDLAVVLGV